MTVVSGSYQLIRTPVPNILYANVCSATIGGNITGVITIGKV
jgi:hypothetical protein